MTASSVYLRILRSFSKHLFYRTPMGNCLFHVQVIEFQPPDTVKNYFTSAFQAFYTRTRSSHSKTFIYLKSMKIICNEVPRCQLASSRKKTISHILFHVFCLHFLRMHHDYFFQRGFESVRAQFLSAESSVTCNLPVRSRFI